MIDTSIARDGLPVRLTLTAGEAHDNRLAGGLLSRLKSGSMLLADRGYDADWIRALVKKRRAWANIPPTSNRNEAICFSPHPTLSARISELGGIQLTGNSSDFRKLFVDAAQKWAKVMREANIKPE